MLEFIPNMPERPLSWVRRISDTVAQEWERSVFGSNRSVIRFSSKSLTTLNERYPDGLLLSIPARVTLKTLYEEPKYRNRIEQSWVADDPNITYLIFPAHQVFIPDRRDWILPDSRNKTPSEQRELMREASKSVDTLGGMYLINATAGALTYALMEEFNQTNKNGVAPPPLGSLFARCDDPYHPDASLCVEMSLRGQISVQAVLSRVSHSDIGVVSWVVPDIPKKPIIPGIINNPR